MQRLTAEAAHCLTAGAPQAPHVHSNVGEPVHLDSVAFQLGLPLGPFSCRLHRGIF